MKVILRDRRGLAIALEKQLIDLMGKIQETFPAHLDLNEQGAFYARLLPSNAKAVREKGRIDRGGISHVRSHQEPV